MLVLTSLKQFYVLNMWWNKSYLWFVLPVSVFLPHSVSVGMLRSVGLSWDQFLLSFSAQEWKQTELMLVLLQDRFTVPVWVALEWRLVLQFLFCWHQFNTRRLFSRRVTLLLYLCASLKWHQSTSNLHFFRQDQFPNPLKWIATEVSYPLSPPQPFLLPFLNHSVLPFFSVQNFYHF